MQIGRRMRGAAPAQARQERAVARPPQPDAGEREDQHADAHPADDGTAGIFGDGQVLVKAMQPAEQRRAKIHDVEHARGRRIEIDVDGCAPGRLRRAARRAPSRSPASLPRRETGRLPVARFLQAQRSRSPDKPRAARPAYRSPRSGGMDQGVEVVVPHQQRARNRDWHQEKRSPMPIQRWRVHHTVRSCARADVWIAPWRPASRILVR